MMMKRYIAILLILLCTSCGVSQPVPYPAPVPQYHELLAVHAFGKLDAWRYVDWMYFDIDCERCE